jgi:hypothetical protein
MAKSTSMMPFFFTMPIRRMMAMMPIADSSIPPAFSASTAPMPARIVSGQGLGEQRRIGRHEGLLRGRGGPGEPRRRAGVLDDEDVVFSSSK